MNDGIILLGGGLDSTALLIDLVKQKLKVHGLFIDYGQKAIIGERHAVKYFCKKYNVPLTIMKMELNKIATSNIMKGTAVGSRPSRNILEGRNAIFATLATTFAATKKTKNIYFGFHVEPKASQFEDAKMKFVKQFNEFVDSYLRKNHKNIRLITPYSKMTRQEIFERSFDMDDEIITRSFTCYEPGYKECGECVHCRLKTRMLDSLYKRRELICEES